MAIYNIVNQLNCLWLKLLHAIYSSFRCIITAPIEKKYLHCKIEMPIYYIYIDVYRNL